MTQTAVIAIGGNSLIKDKNHRTVSDQYQAVVETCVHIADLIQSGYNVVITHGNGPQVGFLLRRSELARHELHEVPLDSCGADLQGGIGYQIQQALDNEFRQRDFFHPVVTVVTQVVVSEDDPAFQNPTKPIGSFMDREEAEMRQREENWQVVEDAGRGYRRVVPSPLPLAVIELDAISLLLQNDFCVVAAGGGGIPVVQDESGFLKGVAAVIDKDYASSLLASKLQADLFIISTAVEKAAIHFQQPNQQDLDQITVEEALGYLEAGHFAEGSMKPKIKAAVAFVKQGGARAIITSPDAIARAIRGETGTHICA